MKNSDAIIQKARVGFTLIEMIAVLAIMAILAAVVTPNVLHSIEVTAVKAEAENLRSLGNQVGLYLRDNGVLPTEGNNNWNNQLAVYSSLNAADILTNKRQNVIPIAQWVPRVFVVDPIAANQRAMLISSMRYPVAIPSLANLKANFAGIWNTAENTVPPGAWVGWGAGPAPLLNNIEYLVIERINLSPIYRNELQPFSVTLNHLGAGTVSYRVVPVSGAPTFGTLTSAAPNVTLSPLRSRDRVNLYSDPLGTVLKYSYVVSNSSKTFDYTTGWAPQ